MYNNNSLRLMRTRLENGGGTQRQRMIKDKRRTLDRAIQYSYQGAQVRKIGDNNAAPALINPNVVKQDYDEKILSIGYEYNIQSGDVFEWVNTNTKWLVYLQDLTEAAYFRGNVRKCSYEISWKDEEGNIQSTYAAIRGPQETSLASMQKFGNSIDLPNYKIYLLLPNRNNIKQKFQRYSEFYLKDIAGQVGETCWRVEAVDSISNPGIIEVYASEYYSNLDEDDMVNGIVGGLIKEPEVPVSDIEGETFIKPKKTYIFTYNGSENSTWLFDTKLPIETQINDKEISVKWVNTYSGQFTLSYGSATKTIVVESLF